MYSKEQVIHKIGEDHWEAFETFMVSKRREYDDAGLEVYYVGHVAKFLEVLTTAHLIG